jgi:cytochrome P450
MEMRIALEELTRRIESFRLQEGARLEPLATFVILGLRGLPLQVNLAAG